MRHLVLTDKTGEKSLVHVDDLKQAFKAADRMHTTCILRVKRRDNSDAYLNVKESVPEIMAQMVKLVYYTDHGQC